MNGPIAFSLVMMLCTICNLTGMMLGLKPPPMLPWLGGWSAVALAVGLAVAYA